MWSNGVPAGGLFYSVPMTTMWRALPSFVMLIYEQVDDDCWRFNVPFSIFQPTQHSQWYALFCQS